LPEKVKVPRILRAWIGFRQTGLEYERPERLAGTTKYSFAKLYRLATDGLTSASVKPLKVAQLFCILYLLLIFFILLLSVLLLVFFAGSKTMLFAFIMTNLFVALGGLVTSANFFVVNAYIRRMYMETKNRPGFVVSEIVKGRER
jgi:dolichol-phosphate mannosyltransferase